MPFLSLFWLCFIIFCIVQVTKKKPTTGKTSQAQQKQNTAPGKASDTGRNIQEKRVSFNEAFQEDPYHSAGNEAENDLYAEGSDPCHEADLRGPENLQPVPYDMHRREYTGSLNMDSHEGIDDCHPTQAAAMTFMERHESIPVPAETVNEGTLAFNWNGNEVLRAVVMQEVLKRPCERQSIR